jgi:transposase
MEHRYWLSAQAAAPDQAAFSALARVPRGDHRRVIGGIIHIIRNGLRSRDAPAAYGPHKRLYNRCVRWSRLGVFDRIFAALAGGAGRPERVMIDSTHLKAHRTAVGCSKRGISPLPRPHQGRIELEIACGLRRPGAHW